ncbi:hypothetical protein D1007_24256 [Hordeum vulgare]|nr:hypothetical protein D1007_24256 [Hordeum vulgare]
MVVANVDHHPAPLIGLFFDSPLQHVFHSGLPCTPAFAPAHRSNPDLVAAILSGDFFLTTLQARDHQQALWSVLDARGGYLLLRGGGTLLALLNPLARRCERIFDLRDTHIFDDDDYLEGCGLRSSSRSWEWAAIGSSPHGWMSRTIPMVISLDNGMRVGNFIYWPYRNRSYVVVLDPDPNNPRLFVEMIPPLLNLNGFRSSVLGQINGGNMCIAYSNGFNIGFMLRQEYGLDAGAWANIRVLNLTDPINAKFPPLPENRLEIAAMRGSILYLTTSEMFHGPHVLSWWDRDTQYEVNRVVGLPTDIPFRSRVSTVLMGSTTATTPLSAVITIAPLSWPPGRAPRASEKVAEAEEGKVLFDHPLTPRCSRWCPKYKQPILFILFQADMESAMEQEVLESEEPKSVAAVVADILTKECPSSRFLQNVGLESTSKKKFNRSASALDAHVQELEYKLEKERQVAELMREELVEAKKKSEEANAARAAEYQLLLKRVEDTDARAKASDAKFARLIDLFEGKIA